jgi:hypothetical protein
MKAKNKRVGTKAQIRATRERERRITRAIFLAFILIIVILSAYFICTFLVQPQNQTINPALSHPKAAIVDHLSLTAPNQTFREKATNTLEQAGYTVDYYPGEEVNVEFYRNLPTHGYSLIVLRVHSAITVGSGPIQGSLGLFTSEARSKTKYIYEQLTDRLIGAKFPNEETIYFGISPLFVLHSMKGDFQKATIIQMGCDGLAYTTMAEAFIQKGAKVYISWTGDVLASHTDQATTELLKHLLTETQTIKQAVDTTTTEVGADPMHKSLLTYYPLEVGEQKIEDIKNNH